MEKTPYKKDQTPHGKVSVKDHKTIFDIHMEAPDEDTLLLLIKWHPARDDSLG